MVPPSIKYKLLSSRSVNRY